MFIGSPPKVEPVVDDRASTCGRTAGTYVYLSAALVGLVWPGVMTWTSTVAGVFAGCAGVATMTSSGEGFPSWTGLDTMIRLSFTTVPGPTDVVPNFTSVAVAKPVPLISTRVPAGPLFGVTAVTVGTTGVTAS